MGPFKGSSQVAEKCVALARIGQCHHLMFVYVVAEAETKKISKNHG